MRYELLEKKIKKSSGGLTKTAEAIGVTAKELQDKLDGVTPLYVYDAYAICAFLNINDTEERLKFFYPERPKNGTKEEQERGREVHKDGKKRNGLS